MNLDDLEKQWEDGDEEEELKTENQARFERLEKRRKAAAGPPGSFDPRHVHVSLCSLSVFERNMDPRALAYDS